MSFNFIIDPATLESYSIFSKEGGALLKKYVKDYQTGGVNPKKKGKTAPNASAPPPQPRQAVEREGREQVAQAQGQVAQAQGQGQVAQAQGQGQGLHWGDEGRDEWGVEFPDGTDNSWMDGLESNQPQPPNRM